MNKTRTGRTFWDLLAENPIILKVILGFFIVIAVLLAFLIFNGYSFNTSGISISRENNNKITTTTSDSTLNQIDSFNRVKTKESIKLDTSVLLEKNKPVEKIDNSKIQIENSPGSIITKDQTGDNIIINPEKPKIVFFKNETKKTFKDGYYETKFYFANPEGQSIRNIVLIAIFDNDFIEIKAKISVWTGMVYSGGEKTSIDKLKNSIEFSVPIMADNNYIEIYVKSKSNIQLKDFKYRTY